MKLSIPKSYNIIIFMITLISFLSYEVTLYRSNYQLMLVMVLFLGVVLFLVSINQKSILSEYIITLKKNPLIHFLAASLLVSTFISSLKYNLITINGLFSVTSTIVTLYLFFLYIPKIIVDNLDRYIKFLISIITICSIISIVISISGSFLGYTSIINNRVSSIFFDPNYFGTIAAIGFILCYHNKYIVFSIINLIALYFSGSRSAMLGLIFTFVVFFFYKKKISLKSLTVFFFIIFSTLLLVIYLYESDYFRIYQGLSSRETLWQITFDLIKLEPLWGYGYGSVGDLIRAGGGLNISSHNAYFDYILTYGLLTFSIYLLVVVNAVLKGLRNNAPVYIVQSVIFLLIVANSISINLGGLGIVSLLLTFFLGICNKIKQTNESFSQNR